MGLTEGRAGSLEGCLDEDGTVCMVRSLAKAYLSFGMETTWITILLPLWVRNYFLEDLRKHFGITHSGITYFLLEDIAAFLELE